MNYYSYELDRLGFESVDPLDFYRDVFPVGELAPQRKQDDYRDGEYAAIAICVTNDKKSDGTRKVKRYTITDDFDTLDLLMYSDDFCFMSPISYAGKNRTSINARFMYSLCVELDNLCIQTHKTKKPKEETYNVRYNKNTRAYEKYDYVGLHNLIKMFDDDKLPRPTYIAASGTGLHLYYIFNTPIPLFPNIVKEIEKYKRELTKKIWNKKVTYSYKIEDIQFESIFQGFRIPGTLTKTGLKSHDRRNDITTVHSFGEKVDVSYMNLYVQKEKQMQTVYKSKLTLKKAKELYPEWYDRRIVNGEKKGHWVCSENVYKWWYNRIYNETRVGHRYYCLMMLAIYAVKCEISQEQLEHDCFSLLSKFEEKTIDENNHFTEKDVLDALQAYENKDFVTYPINSIQNRSGLHIEKNKRNGRKQKDHIEYMNKIREFKTEKGECLKAGRPKGSDKSEIVKRWRKNHPEGKKAQCIKETGLSKHTVYKWWNGNIDNENYNDDIITF